MMAQPTPDPTNPRNWLASYARVQKLADRELNIVLQRALRDVTRTITVLNRQAGLGAMVRREQLLHVKRQLLRTQAEVFNRLGRILEARRVEAAAAALKMTGAMDSVLFGAAGRTAEAIALRDSMLLGLSRTVEVAVVRMTQSAFPLQRRIYNTRVWMDGRLDVMINSALARGLSPAEFAREARDWFNPATPGGVRYAANRLARTEINNAFHAIAVNAAVDKPWVSGMKWHLSRSHPKPDDCDSLAHDDPSNLGEGVYRPRDVPRKPHPHCFCYVTPEVIDEDEFLDNLVAGNYDTYLKEHGAIPSHEPLHLTLVPPPKPAPPKKAPAKPAKSPEQLKAEKLKRSAKAHAKKVVQMPEGKRGQRALVTKELQTQANKTPASMLKLQSVEADYGHTQKGNKFNREQGSNTGAYYTYSGPLHEIHISPNAFDNFDSYTRSFSSGGSSTGRTWHVPTSRPGLESVVAHEYGHHLDAIITSSTGTWPEAVADRFFPELAKELGVATVPGRSFAGRVVWTAFDDWVTKYEKQIKHTVSTYGAKNGRELIAEIWCEYSTAKKPRPHILRLGRLLQQLAEEASA